MNKTAEKFMGLGVAMVTPFHENGEIDFESLEQLTHFLITQGVDYLVVLGTTGESVTLNEKEQREVVAKVIEVNQFRVPIVLGAGSNNTAGLLSKLKSLDYSGIDAVLSVAPYYNKPNQSGMFGHFMHVADASKVPVILYNVPGRTSSNLLPPTVLELAKHENIVAIKEASGSFDQFMAIIAEKPDGFLCISGDDGITLPFIAAGGDGVISVVGNGYPQLVGSMVESALKGDFTKARELHYRIHPMIPLLFEEGNPAGIKQVLHLMGICKPHVRLPLVEITEDLKTAISDIYNQIPFD